MPDRSSKHTWHDLTPVYEERARNIAADRAKGKPTGLSRKHQVLQRYMDRLPPGAVLDIGSGTGVYTAHLVAQDRPLVISADLSRTILRLGRDEVRTQLPGDATAFVCCNMEDLPFKDGSLDVIVCSQVIEHLLDDRKGFAELHRVLRHGGRLLITTDNAQNLVTRAMDAPASALKSVLRRARSHWAFPHLDYAPDAFAGMLRDAGFTVDELFTFRFSPPSPLSRIPGVQVLTDIVERAVIRLPKVRWYGDIILAMCTKE